MLISVWGHEEDGAPQPSAHEELHEERVLITGTMFVLMKHAQHTRATGDV